MQATEASTLFQSSDALALGRFRSLKATRTSSGTAYGSPIWLNQRYKDTTTLAESGAGGDAGSARILSILASPYADEIWTCESGGVLRRLCAESGRTLQVFRGHTAPVSSFAFLSKGVVVSASWDKTLRFWVPGEPRAVYVLEKAGEDFVKAVCAFEHDGRAMLLSGGSDRAVRCWDIAPLLAWLQHGRQGEAPKLECVASMREHTRPINALAALVGTGYAYSADSMGRIFELQLDLTAPSVSSRLKVRRELRGHETSIYDMRAGWQDEEVHSLDLPSDEFCTAPKEAPDGSFMRKRAQVWSCSGDKTARLFELSRNIAGERSSKAGPAAGTLQPLGSSLTIQHPDFVKSLLPIAHCEHGLNYLATGSADEHVRIYDLEQGGKLVNEIEGHWHEVDAMCAWFRPKGGELDNPKEGKGEWWVVSGSLDGSVRRWSVADLLKPRPPPIPLTKEQPQSPEKKEPSASALTAEEEQELADLMGSDGDDDM